MRVNTKYISGLCCVQGSACSCHSRAGSARV